MYLYACDLFGWPHIRAQTSNSHQDINIPNNTPSTNPTYASVDYLCNAVRPVWIILFLPVHVSKMDPQSDKKNYIFKTRIN